MQLGRLTARAVIGGLFIGHGTQKLFGWFGGPGPEGTRKMMGGLELHPADRNALLAGATETAGGALLALGLATPLAAASLTGTMITAIRKVHWRNGPWNANGGYEYNLVLIGALMAIVDGGPGDLSMDRLFRAHRTGAAWALASLAGGAASSVATVELAKRMAPPPVLSAAAEPGADPVYAAEPSEGVYATSSGVKVRATDAPAAPAPQAADARPAAAPVDNPRTRPLEGLPDDR